MTRADLLLRLAGLLARKAINEAEAARVLDLFDAGEFVPSDLPPVQEDTRNEWLLGLAIVLLLTRGNTSRPLSPAKRTFARNTLRRGFEADMQRLANAVASGKIPLDEWQSEMQDAISRYTRQMAVAGAGTLPVASTQAIVEAQLAEQWPFLRGFALTLTAKRLVEGKPLSVAAIANRAKLYGGAAWGSFFLGQGDGAGYGIVDQWISRDDRHVCSRCAPRHLQYFRMGESPYPGWDCLGSCRCERRPVYAPEMYAKLTGQKAA